ncbi:MAG: hypothetical protein R3F20_14020 [Planctomycetota bacterium]
MEVETRRRAFTGCRKGRREPGFQRGEGDGEWRKKDLALRDRDLEADLAARVLDRLRSVVVVMPRRTVGESVRSAASWHLIVMPMAASVVGTGIFVVMMAE